MKKQILKIFSVVLCATTLMPTALVVRAAGEDEKNDSKSPASVNESKTSSEEEESVQASDDNEKEGGKRICVWGNKEIVVKKPKIRTTNRSQRARQRQEVRKTSKRYRFLSQAYTANITPDMITKSYPLPTPFGDVNCDLNKGKVGIDIWVKKDDYRLDYISLCNVITSVLNIDGQKELAKLILNYLETSVDNNIQGRDLFKLEKIGEKIFIKNRENHKYFNLNSNGHELMDIDVKNAKRCASILSGILFVAESSENRMFDGGKSARAVLRAIISGDKTFEEAFIDFNGKGPWYPIAQPGGADIARKRSRGESVSDYDRECFEQIEDHKYMSDSSVEESSDEELSDEELGEESAVK